MGDSWPHGAFVPGEQGAAARLIVSWDRGPRVRTPDAYVGLAESTFAHVRCAVLHGS